MKHALIILLLLFSCTPSRELCEKNYGQCGVVDVDTIYKVKEVTYTVPGGVIESYIYDTLHLRDTLRISDATGVAVLEWYKTENGRLKARCTAKERYVTVLDTIVRIKEVKNNIVPCPPDKPSYWYWWFGGGFILAIALPYIIKLVRKAVFPV